ncbi:hypothetical protein FRAHR75_400002 [Frankia sp. Hr75.2]|nr:hypothetical protein FRAHR75_400002 [Frankia sp. Hr75.2]
MIDINRVFKVPNRDGFVTGSAGHAAKRRSVQQTSPGGLSTCPIARYPAPNRRAPPACPPAGLLWPTLLGGPTRDHSMP